MSQSIKIAIPSPCHENWSAMTPTEKGRFCMSCEKQVYDFTNSSDRQISKVLIRDQNACGRFNTSQLDRDLVVPRKKNPLWLATSAAVVNFLVLSPGETIAQTPVRVEKSEIKTKEPNDRAVSGKTLITGIIRDSESFPIPGVNISIANSTTSTQTDFDGNFSISANKNDILQIDFIGMISQKITIESQQNLLVTLIQNDEFDNTPIIAGRVSVIRKTSIVGGATMIEMRKNRTFVGRIFHSIGNLFR